MPHNSQDKTKAKKKVCGHKAGTWHVQYGRVIITCRNCGKETSLEKRWHTIPQEYDTNWVFPTCWEMSPKGKDNEEYEYRVRCNLKRHHKGKHKNDRGDTW